MIEVIGFDLDDTLWEVRPVILRAESVLGDWLKLEAPGLKYTMETMRELRHELLKQDPTLAGQITEFRRRLIELALSRSGVSESEELSHQAIEVFLAARNEIEFFPGTLEALHTLSSRYTLCALSNGNADIRRLGLHELFSFAYSAEQVGAPKPDPALFQNALAHSGLNPEQMIYVGDDPHLDIDAAKDVGLRTIWMNHKLKKRGRHQADEEIREISEIVSAVGRVDLKN